VLTVDVAVDDDVVRATLHRYLAGVQKGGRHGDGRKQMGRIAVKKKCDIPCQLAAAMPWHENQGALFVLLNTDGAPLGTNCRAATRLCRASKEAYRCSLPHLRHAA
jgi:hypothetical protein